MTLSTRIEQAGGPSRGLDAEIELAIGNWSIHHFDAWNHFQECGEAVNPPMCQPVDPAHYTTSLDAAMTLVPEDMRDEIEINTLYRVARVAINLNHGPDDGPYYGSSEVNSIPLALCAAALRARGL